MLLYTSAPVRFDDQHEGKIIWGKYEYWQRLTPSRRYALPPNIPLGAYTFDRLIQFKGLENARIIAERYRQGGNAYAGTKLVKSYQSFLENYNLLR